MFQEIFDWTDENDEQSDHIRVNPGDVISASVTYQKGVAWIFINTVHPPWTW